MQNTQTTFRSMPMGFSLYFKLKIGVESPVQTDFSVLNKDGCLEKVSYEINPKLNFK